MAMTTATGDVAALRRERRQRVAALHFDYEGQPKVALDRCNLCAASSFIVIAHHDRYGYPAAALGCRRCGLVVLNPVMTAEAYGHFYGNVYRPLVSAYHGRIIDAHSIKPEQQTYAQQRGEFLAPFLAGRAGARMLDIGGSTGVVAHALAQQFGLRATVLDPAPSETSEARALGLEIIEGLVERHDFGGQRFDVVVMCQTSDHLLDVLGTLQRVRALMTDDGLFFMDVVDFRSAYLREWSIEDAIKIDHPYYFSEFNAVAYLARAGFEILRTDYEADHLHVGYVCRPATPVKDALPDAATVERFFREIRYVQNAPRPA